MVDSAVEVLVYIPLEAPVPIGAAVLPLGSPVTIGPVDIGVATVG